MTSCGEIIQFRERWNKESDGRAEVEVSGLFAMYNVAFRVSVNVKHDAATSAFN